MLDQFLWGHSSRVCDISCSIINYSCPELRCIFCIAWGQQISIWNRQIDSSTTVNSEIFARTLFRETSHAKFRENKTLEKWQNTLSFIDKGKSCLNREFFTSLVCLLMLFAKNKILAKISESTVI